MSGPLQAASRLGADPITAAVASPLGQQIFFFAAQLEQAFRDGMLEVFAPLDLDIRQYTTLAYISEGLSPTQHELAKILHLDPSQVVTLVKALARRDLIERYALPQDRRAKSLRITPQGRDLYQQASAAVVRVEEALTASLSRRERSAVLRLMERMLPVV